MFHFAIPLTPFFLLQLVILCVSRKVQCAAEPQIRVIKLVPFQDGVAPAFPVSDMPYNSPRSKDDMISLASHQTYVALLAHELGWVSMWVFPGFIGGILLVMCLCAIPTFLFRRVFYRSWYAARTLHFALQESERSSGGASNYLSQRQAERFRPVTNYQRSMNLPRTRTVTSAPLSDSRMTKLTADLFPYDSSQRSSTNLDSGRRRHAMRKRRKRLKKLRHVRRHRSRPSRAAKSGDQRSRGARSANSKSGNAPKSSNRMTLDTFSEIEDKQRLDKFLQQQKSKRRPPSEPLHTHPTELTQSENNEGYVDMARVA